MVRKKEAPMKEVAVSFTRKYPLMEKVCVFCGKTFMGTRLAKYDTNACRQSFNYNKHVEKYRESKRESYRRQRKQRSGESRQKTLP